MEIPFNIGVNDATNFLTDWDFVNVNIKSWTGTLSGAFQLRGYGTDPGQMKKFRFNRCRVVPSSGGSSNAAIRAIAMEVESVDNSDFTGTFSGYGALSTNSGGVFLRQFNNKGLSTNQLNGLDAQSNKITNVTNPTSSQDAATKNYVDSTVASATPDATSSTKGKVQLSGDLGGTAASPTTPTAVHVTGTETIGGAKTFTTSPTISTGAPALNLVENDQTAPAGVYRVDVSEDAFRIVRSSTVLTTVNSSTFALMRSLTLPLATKTANHTLTPSDSIIPADASSGASTLSLTSQYQSVTVVSNGSNWLVL